MNLNNALETIITIIILQELVNNDQFGSYFDPNKDNYRRKTGSPDKRRKRPDRDKSNFGQEDRYSDQENGKEYDSGQEQQNPNQENDNSELEEKFSQHIVVFNSQLDEEELEEKVQNWGGEVKKKLPLINGFVCNVGENKHKVEIESISGVEKVEKDLTLEIKSTENVNVDNSPSEDEIPWGIKAINTLEAWEDFNKVNIGVIDTGVDLTHYDLTPVQSGINVINSGRLPKDDNGHGTHVSGTVAARKNNKGVVGVAPEIAIHPIKSFNEDGKGKISSIVESLQWSIQNDMQILNMSFGISESTTALKRAITRAYEEEVIMIAAAGNDGSASVDYPAQYPEVIAVGAINERNNIADFSNYGEGLDVLAPGVNIKSTWLDDEFKQLDGTSMAAPHVTGIAALTLSLFDDVNPKEFKELLKKGATPVRSSRQRIGLANAAQTLKIAREEMNN